MKNTIYTAIKSNSIKPLRKLVLFGHELSLCRQPVELNSYKQNEDN